jgi:hypothetical protein
MDLRTTTKEKRVPDGKPLLLVLEHRSDVYRFAVQICELERVYLLLGEASVFMDDKFVSKSQIKVNFLFNTDQHIVISPFIQHVSLNDPFKTSLGVNSALRVTYPAAKTLNRTTTQSNFAFLAKEKRTISA